MCQVGSFYRMLYVCSIKLLIAWQYNRISEELHGDDELKISEVLMVCRQPVLTASRSCKLTNRQKKKISHHYLDLRVCSIRVFQFIFYLFVLLECSSVYLYVCSIRIFPCIVMGIISSYYSYGYSLSWLIHFHSFRLVMTRFL